MGEGGTALRAVLLAACVAALAALQLPAASGARSPASPNARVQTQRERAQAAWLSVASLGTRLERTQAALVRFRAKREAISGRRSESELGLHIARQALAVSQERLGERLRVLYERGDADPLAVLLGAGSIDEAIAGLDGIDRMARRDRDYVREARTAKRALLDLTWKLAAREAEARRLEQATEATAVALAAARRERAGLLAGAPVRRRSSSAPISSFQSQARMLAAVSGRRVVTVTATGYSLSGMTATGVPVGYGVVAVDPSVIGLGTRMTIPGYGEGVAADTGGGVSGARIDLWFPTHAEALAWGTRTLAVTLH